MRSESSSQTQPNWFVIGVIAIVGAFIFFQPFLAAICIAALTAYIFAPLYRVFARRMPNGIAATLTMLTSFAVVVIPLAILLIIVVSQGVAFANTLASLSTKSGEALSSTSHPVADTVNVALAPFNNNHPVVTPEGIHVFAKETLPELIKSFARMIVGFAASLPSLVTSLVIYGFLFNTYLLYSKTIRRIISVLSPFHEPMNELYIERAGAIVKASLQGQFLIAFTTAVASALLLFLVGMQDYFLFFVFIFTLLGMIPLGSGIVMIPIGIVAMLTGQFWQGLWLLIIYLLVVCNIDSFLRPRLVPRHAKLLPAIMTLSVFCGLYYFGFLGVIYGPLIAIILTTTFDVYAEYREQPAFKKPPVVTPL